MFRSTLTRSIFAGLCLLLICKPAGSQQSPYLVTADADSTSTVASGSTELFMLNRNATVFVRKYIRQNTECLTAIRRKSNAPFLIMNRIFAHYELPVELKYLAVVESELNPKAVSRVGAAGTWQLMPSTAQQLGLKVNGKIDERRYCAKSTKAAALYLRDLYSEFGDWLLVLAAYNCGPGPVYSAMKKSGSHNFWKMQRYLPRETSDHVKKFIATHYFFEGKGSVTTLTKSERLQLAMQPAIAAR